MDVKQTLWGTLALASLSACTTLDSHESGGQPAQTVPEWIGDLDGTTLDAVLGPAFEWTPKYDYEPGHYAATVPDVPLDAWERMRNGFALERIDHERVAHQRQLYTGRQGFFQAVASRAEPYLYYILEQIEARDLPTEIVALAIAESGFRPFAYSHGRAAGLWQFIPSTGRIFGLDVNYWYDGRRDLVAATDAALDYLTHLADLFDGDWLLAMASYNAGQGNVRAAQAYARRQGLEPHFWNLRLPAETMVYVPRILALRDILDDPQAYRVTLPPIANEARVRIVEAERQIDLALAAELAGISIEQLYTLNPGFNRWATHPEGPHRLLLPLAEAERFEQGMAALDPDDFVEWRRHTVTAGETLSHIAHSYNITVDLVRKINGLRGDIVRAGDQLYVPVSSRAPDDYSLSAANRLRSLQQRNRQGVRREHTVQPGETLWDISRRYNVSVGNLATWNGMAPGDTLRPHRTLVVWVEGELLQTSGGPSRRTQSVTYTVRSGDSLARIAQRFNVRVNEIEQWNNLTRGGYLQPGQRLRLKVDVTRQGMK